MKKNLKKNRKKGRKSKFQRQGTDTPCDKYH